jgi:hypothetical protein
MTHPSAWIQAARPLAQLNIALPLLLGQALAFAALGRFSLGWMYLTGLFGVLVQLVIVFVNDFADRETDKLNTTFSRFSGGSRVLPEGKLAPATLRSAALVALAALMAMSGGLAVAGRPWAPVLALAAALLVWAYNHPPLRLAYRGHGELGSGPRHRRRAADRRLLLSGRHLRGAAMVGAGADVVARLCRQHPDGAAGRAVGPGERQAQLSGAARAVVGAAARARAAGDGGGDERVGAAGLADGGGGWCWRCRCSRWRRWRCRCWAARTRRIGRECERFVLLTAGAAQLLVLLWALALVLRGLLG